MDNITNNFYGQIRSIIEVQTLVYLLRNKDKYYPYQSNTPVLIDNDLICTYFASKTVSNSKIYQKLETVEYYMVVVYKTKDVQILLGTNHFNLLNIKIEKYDALYNERECLKKYNDFRTKLNEIIQNNGGNIYNV